MHSLQNQRENGTDSIHGEIIKNMSLKTVNGADIVLGISKKN